MMRVRYKPWAEDYLKNHPDLVDMDGACLLYTSPSPRD